MAKEAHPDAARAYKAYLAHPVKPEASQEGAEGEILKSPAISDDSPGQEPEESGAYSEFAEAVLEAKDWPEIDAALGRLAKTVEWAEGGPRRDGARRVAFQRVHELVQGGMTIDLRANLKAWRCYMEWETDLAALNTNGARVQSMGNPAWQEGRPVAKTALDRAWTVRKNALKPAEDAHTAKDFE